MDQYVVKTPGQLPTVFGHENHTNMFYGNTIFCDAVWKYIHVENQVSLGVGEPSTPNLNVRADSGNKLNSSSIITTMIAGFFLKNDFENCVRKHVRHNLSVA